MPCRLLCSSVHSLPVHSLGRVKVETGKPGGSLKGDKKSGTKRGHRLPRARPPRRLQGPPQPRHLIRNCLHLTVVHVRRTVPHDCGMLTPHCITAVSSVCCTVCADLRRLTRRAGRALPHMLPSLSLSPISRAFLAFIRRQIYIYSHANWQLRGPRTAQPRGRARGRLLRTGHRPPHTADHVRSHEHTRTHTHTHTPMPRSAAAARGQRPSAW